MDERRAVPLLLLGLGLAAAAGLGMAFDLGPSTLLTGLVLAGVVLALVAQHHMGRLPND